MLMNENLYMLAFLFGINNKGKAHAIAWVFPLLSGSCESRTDGKENRLMIPSTSMEAGAIHSSKIKPYSKLTSPSEPFKCFGS